MSIYRDTERFSCPACGAELRPFLNRLCCDACSGIMLDLKDLTLAIADHTHRMPILDLIDKKPSKRACPRCHEPLTECHLDTTIDESCARLEPTLDRCTKHGVWFDANELATILEALRRSTEPGGASAKEIALTMIKSFGDRARQW